MTDADIEDLAHKASHTIEGFEDFDWRWFAREIERRAKDEILSSHGPVVMLTMDNTVMMPDVETKT